MSRAGSGDWENREEGMACSHRGALKSCSNGNCFVKTANCQLACCHIVEKREEKVWRKRDLGNVLGSCVGHASFATGTSNRIQVDLMLLIISSPLLPMNCCGK